MVYGYARVSTEEQSVDGQVAELKALGCDEIIIEKASAKSRKRPELEKLLESLLPGDIILVVKIDRLARSLKDLIFLLEEIAAKEAVLKLGASSFDFSSAEGRLTANLLGSVAQFERELISERTRLGLKAAREMGRFGGRPKGMTDEAKLLAKDAYEMRIKGYLISEILQLTGIKSKQTLYKYIRYHVQILSEKTGRKIAENELELR